MKLLTILFAFSFFHFSFAQLNSFHYDTLMQGKKIEVNHFKNEKPVLSIYTDNEKTFSYEMNNLGDISINIEDLNNDSQNDVIINMSSNRNCNYIFLMDDKTK